MSGLDHQLDSLLQQRKSKGRFRSLKTYDTSKDSNLVDFSSNDYLSITTSKAARQGLISRFESSPAVFGSTGSRLLSGSTTWHASLEKRFATFFHSPEASLFNSGWDANVSFFSTVPQPKDWVIYDELVHASVHSGMRASRVPTQRRLAFKHNDPASLRRVSRQISNEPGASDRKDVVFSALESSYSMDGDMAPLPAILDAMDEYIPRSRQCVVLDEAHSTGVYGRQGRGMGHALGEEGGWGDEGHSRGKGRIDVRSMTFGKAVGCSGAVLSCSPTIRSFLINFARPLIFSTASPHSTSLSLESVWDVLESQEGDDRRQSLYALADHLHSLLVPILKSTSPNVLRSPPTSLDPFPQGNPYLRSDPASPILGLITPEPHASAQFFLDRGFIVRPVVPPTVPPGEERVRICLRAGMDKAVVERLAAILQDWASLKGTRQAVQGPSQGVVSLRAKL